MNTVITPNKRLARAIEQQRANGQNLPRTSGDILPYSAWLNRTYFKACREKHIPAKTLLNASQSLWLWQSIIRKHYKGLANINALAQQAQAAWKLAQDWQLSLDDARLNDTLDSLQWTHWAKTFKAKLDENHWIDEACLASELLKCTPQSPKIEAQGLFDLSPRDQALWEQHNIQHCKTEKIPTENRTQKAFKTSEDELQAAASFAYHFHQSTPKKTLAIIIPDLKQRRAEIEQCFRYTFNQTLEDNHRLDFTISYGQSLSALAIIETAFLLLDLGEYTQASTLSALLRSPFIAGAKEEASLRAKLDQALREQTFDIHLPSFLNAHQNDCPIWCEQFKQWTAWPDKRLAPEDWIRHITQRLTQLGFCRDTPLSSLNYQAMTHFHEKLEALQALALFKPKLSAYQAINWLKQSCQQTLFQAESHWQANIHILGLLEAADQSFDTVWHMGLSEAHWPPEQHAASLLPRRLQRELAMPGGDPALRAEFYSRLFESTQVHCRECIATYLKEADGVALAPASCIAQWPEDQRLQTKEEQTALNLETQNDWQAPRLSDDEKPRGGTQILKRQALCPFKAFAESRLHAQSPEDFEHGLTPAMRGQIIHALLEDFWRNVQNLENLQNLSEKNLSNLINDMIDNALTPFKTKLRYYLNTEKTRLNTTLTSWLRIEKTREPFQIKALEQQQNIAIGPLTLSTRIDRVDRLSDNTLILIDYKSSANSPQSWLGPRPDEPQLPLYSLKLTQPIAAIVFAEINPKAYRFNGICTDTATLPGLSKRHHAELDELKAEWQITLAQLATDFFNGVATLDPKTQSTCQRCSLQALCRINDH
ncbi:MAG: hypothetical protein COV52_05355 [Gammaproteobacteria bacterium CG11_big_fil_rev_8_21_14_0_20_46_22]|nr:MAG: hypothetical protein COW05_00520 [Gammaproteobacteria bacterium CG12_big_fil_rev_8_21_14_0_65_46_12]PIR11157.1 MAG: hypothetical protein COV52_05355 [Gammaproteobacteria bacterium CG11_big_fil_rev_8_21_14_0_20_46_22]